MLRGLGDEGHALGTTGVGDRPMPPHFLQLVVPGLPTAPFVGDGCCSVVPAEVALAEALGAWPGVLAVVVDVASGTIDLELGSSWPSEEDLTGTISDLGYRVDAVQVVERR